MSEKTTELIIYIAEQLKDSPNYGAILLNKSLYYTDLMQYLTNGNTITDFQYIHQEKGPTPEPGRFMTLLKLLYIKIEAYLAAKRLLIRHLLPLWPIWLL